HRTTQLESAPSERPFAERMGWAPDDVRGRLVFDVGCGMGRSADMVLRWGGRVVSVDLSYAVDSAGRILPTTRVSSPSRRASSNCRSGQSPSIIYSIGVLPHTPDTGRAFQCLPPLSVRAAMPRSRCTPCTPTRNKGVKSVSPETHGYDSYDWRALDTFDWYSPQYQFKHSYPEVFAWFSKAGLVNSEL